MNSIRNLRLTISKRKVISLGLILMILLSTILGGCGKKDSTTKKISVEETKIMEDFKGLLDNKNSNPYSMVTWINANIKNVSKDNASIMINGLQSVQTNSLPELFDEYLNGKDTQQKLRAIYYEGFNKSDVDKISHEDLKTLLTTTYFSGYKLINAEAQFIPTIDYTFYNQYSQYLTQDFIDYISLMITHLSKRIIIYGDLKLTWDEIVQRSLKYQEFITLYPNSIKINDVKYTFKDYFSYTMSGVGHSPLFDPTSKQMVPEAKEAYLNAIKDSTKTSPYLKVLRDYMDLLKKSDYKLTDEIDKFRENAIKSTKF